MSNYLIRDMKTVSLIVRTIFLSLIFASLCYNSKAQTIDTVQSDYVYLMLTACGFNKTIIDGRDSLKFYGGHIKNAVYVDAFGTNIDGLLQKYITEDTLVVYCTKKTRSGIIIDNLKILHYRGLIIYMQDGLTGWKKNEFEVVVPLTNETINPGHENKD
ncbi:MAG: rhodanese-like domain-containing protein [Salinivirgaceae bacterium]|nr:rhodanese-like domain-containing protein [Salinivirgaceae bacterium]